MIIGALNLGVWVCTQATIVGAYSYYIVCTIITMYLSRSISASDIGFPMYATRINVFDA